MSDLEDVDGYPSAQRNDSLSVLGGAKAKRIWPGWQVGYVPLVSVSCEARVLHKRAIVSYRSKLYKCCGG